MGKFLRPVISASLSPNTQGEDVLAALVQLVKPLQWRYGKQTGEVEAWFRNTFHTKTAVSFNSGRSALVAVLSALGIGEGDEVIVQAFTCVAVPNCVLWAGATPIYVDIDATLNIDIQSLKSKITKRTKAIIVQHTFGIPADMTALGTLAKKHNILVIEDCAHSLGATIDERLVGTFGDAAIFSFGRDKIVSSVWGGMAIINDTCRVATASARLAQYHKTLRMPQPLWIMQQLFHPIAFWMIIPLYTSGIGKVMLVLLQRLRLLSFPVQPMELNGGQPKEFPSQYPNALASLLLVQLHKLDRYRHARKEVVQYYQQVFKEKSLAHLADTSLLRYPLQVTNPVSLRIAAKRRGILLGNWYAHVIDPAGSDRDRIGYVSGSCPNAEKIAASIINLPTRISLKEAQAIVAVVG